MQYYKYFVIAFAAASALLILIFAFLSKRPLRLLLLNALAGICALAAINLTARFSGVHIPINQATAVGGCVFGLPAIAGFLLLNFIFM